MTDATLNKVMIQSILGPLANKVKLSALNARKNRSLGKQLQDLFAFLFEQLLPHYLAQNHSSQEAVNSMHNLCYLLAHKTQQVFTSHVIHTAIDQNWDMKGLKQVLVRILKNIGADGYDGLVQLLDQTIKNQNLQSSSCIKAINSFVRNARKIINPDDLANSISVYETDFEFVKEDIEKYRAQRIKYECFSVLHPWAYDLDQVDFKYIINNNISDKVMHQLKDENARIFWLSNFKCQTSVSADDFFQALRECHAFAGRNFDAAVQSYHQIAAKNDFVFSILHNADTIQECIRDAMNVEGCNPILNQVFSKSTEQGTNHIKTVPAGFSHKEGLGHLAGHDFGLQLREVTGSESDMQRRPYQSVPNRAASHKLNLVFEAVDTEEIKGLQIGFNGDQGVFKIGEGDANHYQIPNDKKLWESQLMIVCKDGNYYVRDLGIVHTSRIKIDKNTEVRIQQDMLVDLGKVVHYHFNKVTHHNTPSVTPSQNFQVLFSNENYVIEESQDDPPALRARPTWVSSDENKDLIQKEILLEAYNQKQFTIGRSMKREV
jgi:hypothetical protein